jgi:hypothetical protein
MYKKWIVIVLLMSIGIAISDFNTLGSSPNWTLAYLNRAHSWALYLGIFLLVPQAIIVKNVFRSTIPPKLGMCFTSLIWSITMLIHFF